MEPASLRGKTIGYRSWSLDGYRLQSANRHLHAHWLIGANEAECRRPELLRGAQVGRARPAHTAPSGDCGCGLHAWYRPNSRYARGQPGTTVHGAITAWGTIEAHWQGFRAQYAQPVVLSFGPDEPREQVERVEILAGELQLPFVPLDQLEAEARKYGTPVPMEMRPAPPAHVHPYARALALAGR